MGADLCADDDLGEQRVLFESKIRPVLVQHCYQCHSSDSDQVGGKLLLDSRHGLLAAGESGPVIDVDDPESSLLVQAMRYEGTEMPPDGQLSPAIVNDFLKWIELGAHDPREGETSRQDEPSTARESLWSFSPRNVSAIPSVARSDWPNDSIDHFVLAELERRKIGLAQDADSETLVRRLYHDLIGLPPTLDQIQAFARSHESNPEAAISQMVDSLLASPQFGVRWGRHWLDVARYGESNGDDGLGRNATFPHAWRYRDYVINSLNQDIAYDRFITEQIAGDLLPAETAAERNRLLTATGFLAIGSKPAAAMNKDFAMDIVDDQINAVCTTVLGLSVACARCHDHKHDPIPTRDYYALAGIFRSTETLYGAAGNEKLTAPPTPLHGLYEQLTPNVKRPDRTKAPDLESAYSSALAELKPLIHQRLDHAPTLLKKTAKSNFSAGEFATVENARFEGELPRSLDSYSVTFWFRNTLKNNARPITAYLFSRAKTGDKQLPGDHLGIGGNHNKERTGKLFVFNGNDKKQSVSGDTIVPTGSWNHLVFVRNGQNVKVFLNGRLEIETPMEKTFGESTEFCLASRSDDFAPLKGNVGEFAVFDRALSDNEAIQLHTASGQPAGIRPAKPIGYAMGVREKTKVSHCKIHINGQGNKLGPEVPRGVLTAYSSTNQSLPNEIHAVEIAPTSSGRLELARWLTQPDHPQTARVIVNRVWMHLFGKGLVGTPDDFGVYGARPSHPELLDHLADHFVKDGWSIKRLIRKIVLTRTYQLASRCDRSLIEADPENRFLARHSRRRLDAESLRDRLLHAGGTIDWSPEQGSAVQEIDALINWPPGEATDLHRPSNHRSVYLCMLRHAAPKQLAAFDLPDGVAIAGRREQTTRPTQALFLINSDCVIDQSRALAKRILKDPHGDDEQRVQKIFVSVLNRHASHLETRRGLELVKQTDQAMSGVITEPSRRRVACWASLCQALMSTNEFRHVD